VAASALWALAATHWEMVYVELLAGKESYKARLVVLE
jgi:hypothetical protein